ncbi:MAG: DUF1963 domain-containing protein [Bacilli bacterium]|nr:DUF1963 domain-containing protein [Bacilli bacterium]
MEPLKFSLKRVEVEENAELDTSKLLGSPVVPADFLKRNGITENYYFVAQINLSEVPPREGFPKKGFMYFFVEVDELKAKVLYTEEEPSEVIEDINENFDPDDYGDPTCLQMKFAEKGGSAIFSEVDPDIGLDSVTDIDDKVMLLLIDALSLPQEEKKPFIFTSFGMGDGYWAFLITKEDLAKRNFKNVEFIDIGY